jgi:hypothetical protein
MRPHMQPHKLYFISLVTTLRKCYITVGLGSGNFAKLLVRFVVFFIVSRVSCPDLWGNLVRGCEFISKLRVRLANQGIALEEW